MPAMRRCPAWTVAERLPPPQPCREERAVATVHCGNLLLGSLEPEAFAFVRPHLEQVPLKQRHVIAAADDPMDFVWFPECGLTSIADVLADGRRIEVALIGRDGMINSQLLLGGNRASFEASVQAGEARLLRLDARILRELCARHESAHRLFLRFTYTLSVQTARTLASTVRDCTEKRLSRWLLMCHDRVDGDDIGVGHRHIGDALGVRRSTVTDTVHIVEGRGAILGRRGRITIRDRRRLEEIAGASYGFPETNYRSLIGPFGKGSAGAPDPASIFPPPASPRFAPAS